MMQGLVGETQGGIEKTFGSVLVTLGRFGSRWGKHTTRKGRTKIIPA